MRFPVALALWLGACGFQITPSSIEVDAPFFDDGGGLSEVWSFDTAAELAAPGHARVAMAIEPRGSLTPEGYVYGGLLGRGETSVKLWTQGDTSWGKLATVTPTGTGLWTGAELRTTEDLVQFGIRRGSAMRTLWFEGEVYLRVGTEQLRIRGDDIAFVAIAQPGSSTFQPLLESSVTQTASITVPATAWYPVRIGWADGDTSGALAFELMGPQGYAAIRPHRLRAPVAAVQGTLRSVFYRQIHGGGIGDRAPVHQLEASPLYGISDFDPPLQGSVIDPVTSTGHAQDWSARWAGQLYVTTPGQYTVRVTSDDGSRLVFGTAAVQETSWARDDSNGNSSTMVTAALREGWNDLIVDYNQAYGGTLFGVEILSSPDPALPGGAELPLARLRPVEPRGERLIVRSTVPPGPAGVAEDSGVFTDIQVNVAASANHTVTRVDATVVYSSSEPDHLVFRVNRPGGTPTVVSVHPNISGGTRVVTHAFSVAPALVGGPADGIWTIGVADDFNGVFNSNTSIAEVHLTLHTTGGPDQIERIATWQAPIKDLGTQLVKIDEITWNDRTPAGTAVELRLRSCDQPDCSDEASWGPIVAKGLPVVLAQRRYLQAQVTMNSDGTSEPELRSLQIMYRRTM